MTNDTTVRERAPRRGDRLNSEIEGVAALSRALATAAKRSEVETALLDAALGVTGSAMGGIYLLEEATGDFTLTRHRGVPQAAVESVSILPAGSARARFLLAGFAVHGEVAELRALFGEDTFPPLSGVVSILPLRCGGRVLGSLNLTATRPLSDSVAAALEVMASMAALAFGRLQAETRDASSRLLVEASPLPMLLLDGAGRIVDANRAAAEQLGYARDEMLRLAITDVAVGMTPARWQQVWLRVRDLGRDEFRGRHRRRDGSVVPVEVSLVHLRGDGDERCCGCVRDMSDREMAQESLQRQREFLEAVIEHLPVGLFAKDATEDLRFTLWNRKMEAIVGKSRDEVLGRTDYDIVGPAEAEYFRRTDMSVLRHGVVVDIPFETITTDERAVPVHTIKVPILDRQGRPVTLLGILQDLSEHARAEEALRRSDAHLRLVVDQMPAFVWTTDADLRVTTCMGAELVRRGATAEQLIGQPVADVLSPGSAEAAVRAHRAALAGRSESFEIEGRNQVLRARIEPFCDLVGVPIGCIGIAQDVSEIKRVEQQLVQAQKMEAVGRLASGVAHDFNNLLQVISSITQLLPEAHGNEAEFATLLADLEQQIGRGGAVARQLLMFGRRQGIRREYLDLNEVVRESARMLRRLVRESIQIELDLFARPLPLEADRGQLEQVLMNLAVNASDAMSDGGRMTIRTDLTADGEIVLEVRDTGPGIDRDLVDRIFEPFFTTKELGRGTGLGLTVVQEVVARHHGSIGVTSGAEAGTTFTITLPKGETGAAAAAPAAPGELPRGNGYRVLIVEDDAVLRRSLVGALTGLGYEVEAVASAEEALADAGKSAVDGAVIDWVLPRMQGPALARELRSRWPETRIVLISGYAEGAEAWSSADVDWDAFLLKPFGIRQLLGELRPGRRE